MRRLRSAAHAGVLVATLALAGGLGSVTTASASDRSGASGAPVRFIVKRDPAVPDGQFTRALRAADFTVVKDQASLGLSVVEGPAGGRAGLRSLPGVVSVADDFTVHPQTLTFDYSTQPGSMVNVTHWTGAMNMWKAGYTGAGIDVALLDTGVSPVPALAAADKVVVGPDLSFESQAPNARYLDSYGHGTAMGSLIAGRDVPKASGATYAADTRNFYGMAPDARLISLKMADRSGAVDVSQMIAGIDWVVTNRTKVGNIRVLNLSYGARSTQNAQNDPLAWAAEAAWKAGIVVVVSGGNDGETTVGLSSPAYDPWVIAVGASDTRNTATSADDVVAPFSNVGTGRSPDVLAPGVGIVSASAPGSQLEVSYPKAKIAAGYLRGSGTSQAAAVVSGAVALTLQKYPNLTPNEVKRFLARTASLLSNAPTALQGKGLINLGKVVTEAPVYGVTYDYPVGNGKGSLEAARGGQNVTVNGTALKGEVDIMGKPWNSTTMATAAANRTAWDAAGNFNGSAWIGTGMSADTTTWAGRTWSGRTWSGRTWSGNNWNGRTWSTGTWSSSGWSSATWSGPVAKAAWASARWSSASWG